MSNLIPQSGGKLTKLQSTDSELGNALIVAQKKFWSKVFPSKSDQLVEQFTTDLVRIQTTSRIDVLRRVRDFHMATLQDELDEELNRSRRHLTSERAKDVAHEHRNLIQEITDLAIEFWKLVEAQLQEVSQLQNPTIRKMSERFIMKRLDDFNVSADEIANRFSTIAKTGI